MRNRKSGIVMLFLLLVSLTSISTASAQAPAAVKSLLGTPILDTFPAVELYLNLYNEQGAFLNGLQIEQIAVVESNKTLPINSLEELNPGVQAVIAINPGPPFGTRNTKGISRYDFIKEALSSWAKSRQGSNLDDWSLIITNGPEISHVSDPMAWLAELESDQTNPRTATPNLDTLFRAVNLAADNPPRPGMGRAVLFITPPLEGELDASLENLIAQAKQRGVIVFVWIVSSSTALPQSRFQTLFDLAEQTGGKIHKYKDDAELPSPEQFLKPLRSTYHLTYQSGISTGGSHQVSVKIQAGDQSIETGPQTFEINLQPPNPIFVSPETNIQRLFTNPMPSNSTETALQPSKTNAAELMPIEQPFQILTEFPDGHKRPLTYSALYVDGVLADENLEPPFDQFSWDLRTYSIGGMHKIYVEVQDALGIDGRSSEHTIYLRVEQQTSNPWRVIQSNLPWITLIVVLSAGAILALVMVMGGKLRPAALRAATSRKKKNDPVTQVVLPQEDSPAQTAANWVNHLHWPQRHAAPKAYAFLNRISEQDSLAASAPVPITMDEMTLGSDAHQATLLLEDPSVEGLHARLTRLEDGAFNLADEGSVAGTWVNYTPVSQEGVRLEHNDLIQIGRVGFRFTVRQPTQVRKPVVKPKNGIASQNQGASDDPG